MSKYLISDFLSTTISINYDSNILPMQPFWPDYDVNSRLDRVLERTTNMIGGKNISTFIQVILKPFLIYNTIEYSNTYLTGNREIDLEIEKRIKKDYTNVCRIAEYAKKYNKHLRKANYYLKCIDYQFKDGLIILAIEKSNNEPFRRQDYQAIKEAIYAYNEGPETFIERNIVIYRGPELKKIGHIFIGEEEVELGIELVDIVPHLE